MTVNLGSKVVDKAKAADGVWRELTFDDGAIWQVKIASQSNNPAFTAAINKHSKPYAAQFASNAATPEVQDEVNTKAIADAIIKDWKILDDANHPVPHTVENALYLLENVPEFKLFIQTQMQQASNFRAATVEGAVKN